MAKMGKITDAADRCLALCLMTKGEDISNERARVIHYAEELGVTERTIYRYLRKIAVVKFVFADALREAK